MGKGQRSLTDVTGLQVYLPDGRFLGVVHDAVIEHSTMTCTHCSSETRLQNLSQTQSTSQYLGAGYVQSMTSLYYDGSQKLQSLALKDECS